MLRASLNQYVNISTCCSRWPGIRSACSLMDRGEIRFLELYFPSAFVSGAGDILRFGLWPFGHCRIPPCCQKAAHKRQWKVAQHPTDAALQWIKLCCFKSGLVITSYLADPLAERSPKCEPFQNLITLIPAHAAFVLFALAPVGLAVRAQLKLPHVCPSARLGMLGQVSLLPAQAHRRCGKPVNTAKSTANRAINRTAASIARVHQCLECIVIISQATTLAVAFNQG